MPLAGALALVAPLGAWFAASVLGLRQAPPTPWAAIWLLAVAPWLEEVIFRAWIQQGLAQRLEHRGVSGGAHLANILASVTFALCHLPLAGAAAFWWLVPSLALGEVWRRQARISTCVALHAWFNACLVAVTWATAPTSAVAA